MLKRCGSRAKTDAIDAQTLTELAALLQPELWTPPPAIYEEVQQRLTQRDDLLLMRGQLRNQLHALGHMPVVVTQVRQRMEALAQILTAQLATLESELVALLPTQEQEASEEGEPSLDRAWALTLARLQTIPGIGFLTALWIVVTTMNFSLCSSAEQAAAYAGLAPMQRESGTSIRKRSCIGHTGNGRLRTALYLATLSAARYNPVIQRFYERLRAAGKPVKVARCAAARKLLHLAFAVATRPGRILIRSISHTDHKQPSHNRIESIIAEAKHTFFASHQAHVLLTMQALGCQGARSARGAAWP